MNTMERDLAVHRALVEMMNEAATPSGLANVVREVSGAVIPFSAEQRSKLGQITLISVSLMANGMGADEIAQIVQEKLGGDDGQIRRVIDAVWKAGESRAATLDAYSDPDRVLRMALSYHEMTQRGSLPSDELHDFALAIGGGEPNYNEAGRRAMLGMMSNMLSATPHFSFETVSFVQTIVSNAENSAEIIAGCSDGETVREVGVDGDEVVVHVSRDGADAREVRFGQSSSEPLFA